MEINLRQVENFYIRTGLNNPGAQALATFFHQEASLLENFLEEFHKEYPNFKEYLENLYLKICFPIDCTIELEGKLPNLDLMLKSKRQVLGRITHLLDQHSNADEESRQFIEQYSKRVKDDEETIKEAKENIPQFLEFIRRVGMGIDNSVSKRKIITLEDYEMQDKEVRNRIYRPALDKNHWLLGYDIKLITRLGAMLSQDNQNRKEMYDSLNGEMKEVVGQKQYVTLNPEPLGVDIIDGKTLHEQRIANDMPFEQYQRLEQVIKKYFDARIGEVIAQN